MEWGNPWAFWGLLAVPPLLWWSRAYLRRAERWGATATLVLRFAVLLLLLAALAQPAVMTLEHRTDWLFLIDRSDSMTPHMIGQAEGWIAEARRTKAPGDRIAIMSFGGRASLDQGFDGSAAGSAAMRMIAESETNLERAIHAALAEFDEKRRQYIFLVSDGNEIVGRGLNTVESLIGNGVTLSAIAPAAGPEAAEVVLENIVIPGRVNQGDRYRADIVVRSTHEKSAEIRLYLDGVPLKRYDVELQPGVSIYPISLVADSEGMHLLRAEIAGTDDTHPENNRYERFIEVERGPRILLITDELAYSRPMADALHKQGLAVTMVPMQDLPGSPPELAAYDVIVFDNVSGLILSDGQMEAIREYVSELGGGFVMIGGDNSFGGGGYHNTPVETALPVKMDVEMPIELASVALALVIDRSDSMGTDIGLAQAGGSRLEIAKLASLAAVEMLKPSDRVGVVGFDTTALWFVPMGEARRMEDIASQLAPMEPGGGTDIYVGLREAVAELSEERAQKKHIIVLSDGLTRKADFEAIVQKAVAADITLSTVGLANMVDHRLLKNIATWGKGRYYFTDDPMKIPRIFTTETVMVSRGIMEEERFTPRVVADHEILAGISTSALPPLRGYVLTALKPGAEVVLASPGEDPILAVRQYGLGRTVAFTSDLSTAWGRDWVRWAEYPKIVTHLMRWAARGKDGGQFELAVRPDGELARVTADVFDGEGNFLNRATLQARVHYPDGEARTIALRQKSPGRYQGEFPLTGSGGYLLEVWGHRGEEQVGPRKLGLTVPYGREYRTRKPNMPLLARLAQATGGSLISGQPETGALAEIMAAGSGEPVPEAVWPHIVLAAMALFLLDIAFRQLGALRRKSMGRDDRAG